ncbi:unnamed protein product [Periconia digitata]|uniref:Uncharacterized protein n=1 Tax=Periconia digitata TaxID=1303443 RepID=A0A9W4XZ67_9PLEO|nr:unnamed protein product [Periconia digitata]
MCLCFILVKKRQKVLRIVSPCMQASVTARLPVLHRVPANSSTSPSLCVCLRLHRNIMISNLLV